MLKLESNHILNYLLIYHVVEGAHLQLFFQEKLKVRKMKTQSEQDFPRYWLVDILIVVLFFLLGHLDFPNIKHNILLWISFSF